MRGAAQQHVRHTSSTSSWSGGQCTSPRTRLAGIAFGGRDGMRSAKLQRSSCGNSSTSLLYVHCLGATRLLFAHTLPLLCSPGHGIISVSQSQESGVRRPSVTHDAFPSAFVRRLFVPIPRYKTYQLPLFYCFSCAVPLLLRANTRAPAPQQAEAGVDSQNPVPKEAIIEPATSTRTY